MKTHREYPDDDGRSVADMSALERPRLFTAAPRRPSKKNEPTESSARPEWENPAASMPKDDRRAFIGGALSAALLIALAFIVGLGLVILLFTLIPVNPAA